MNLVDVPYFFAEEIRVVANLQTGALVDAFATVPREHFPGPGPWQIANPDACGSNISVRRDSHEPSDTCCLQVTTSAFLRCP
jgi:hypothetical protein